MDAHWHVPDGRQQRICRNVVADSCKPENFHGIEGEGRLTDPST